MDDLATPGHPRPPQATRGHPITQQHGRVAARAHASALCFPRTLSPAPQPFPEPVGQESALDVPLPTVSVGRGQATPERPALTRAWAWGLLCPQPGWASRRPELGGTCWPPVAAVTTSHEFTALKENVEILTFCSKWAERGRSKDSSESRVRTPPNLRAWGRGVVSGTAQV